MSTQRYERVAANDEEDKANSPHSPQRRDSIPSSPPPSFRSRASSISRQSLIHQDPDAAEVDRTLADTFDAPSDDESDDGQSNDRRRLMGGSAATPDNNSVSAADSTGRPRTIERRVTQLPVFAPQSQPAGGRVYGGGTTANDGVFANLSAKPTRGEELEEKPPTYEQAALDAPPPFWETTILSTGPHSDEVFVSGLVVGSLFSFVWNALISMSFQLVGFLLTYLLHTTHAAKNGSRAGLGITLVQWGFQMKAAADRAAAPGSDTGEDPTGPNGNFGGVPADPNAHDFDPSNVASAALDAADSAAGGISANEWMSYVLMVVGWFILIKAVSDFIRARRQEQLVRSSPDRGLGVPVIATSETPETVV
ncbi:hypothetical protein LTR66_013524 [Elasticomyces elasticus]|nr:hypothetical protein LTR66_013524 [Elasticomyces elasticus]